MFYNFVNGYGVTCPDGRNYTGLPHCPKFSDPVSAQLLAVADDATADIPTTTPEIQTEQTASDTWALVGWVALLIVLIAGFVLGFVFFNAYTGEDPLVKAKGAV